MSAKKIWHVEEKSETLSYKGQGKKGITWEFLQKTFQII